MPSFLSGGQNRNDDRRKNIIWLLAKNPARGKHKTMIDFFLSVSFPRFRGDVPGFLGDRQLSYMENDCLPK